ncbi:ABC transporter substrate-binding protein [Pseudochrobactrum saccharolyticum]|nr:ABC transporter substrate-binding protein [Pseudochrobactrum saccharolyticum]KAB0538499.1 ABC transporter substrate-binding protein [Pseudochrobactrum saccharolyticum]
MFISCSKISYQIIALLVLFFSSESVFATDLTIASGDTGNGQALLRKQLDDFEKITGNKVAIVDMPSNSSDQFAQYRLWLAAGNTDIDLYRTDIVWAPQLADQFLDLSSAAKDIVAAHFPSVIQSQTVNGKLIALPLFADAAVLFYRKDLLEKYQKSVPKTFDELTETAQYIQDKERMSGNKGINGYVFQANAYEGLTCTALEWIKSFGAGQVVEADGSISINNKNAIKALENAHDWVGSIAPQGVLGYGEEESRGVWQTGNAVFLRNWPYVYPLSNNADSPIRGKVGVTALPSAHVDEPSAAALGGWNIAVSRYSQHTQQAIELAKFLASKQAQKERAIALSLLPTIRTLYDDPQIIDAQPLLPQWKPIFETAVARPSAPTKTKYNEVSSLFWSAVHDTLSGNGTAADNLARLEEKLTILKGNAW